MGVVKYLFVLYGLILMSTNLLVSVVWFLVACVAVLSWFSLSKGLLLALLYLGGFMVLFIYMMSVDTKMKKNLSLSFVFLSFLLFIFYEGHGFHENFVFLLMMYSNKVFVVLLLWQLLYLLIFLSEELLPIKSVRVL